MGFVIGRIPAEDLEQWTDIQFTDKLFNLIGQVNVLQVTQCQGNFFRGSRFH